jgi:hypothetical protein
MTVYNAYSLMVYTNMSASTCVLNRESQQDFKVLANDKLDALFHVFIYFISLHVSSIRISLLTGIPSSHVHRLIIPDDVLIKFDLLMISVVMLETCREMK